MPALYPPRFAPGPKLYFWRPRHGQGELDVAFHFTLSHCGCESAFLHSLHNSRVLAETLTSFHTFVGTHGCSPTSGLIRGKDGNFYGITSGGGGDAGEGTVFKITPAGKFTSIYAFACGNRIGAFPFASPIRDAAGNLYGTTSNGGPSNAGIVWKELPPATRVFSTPFPGTPMAVIPIRT